MQALRRLLAALFLTTEAEDDGHREVTMNIKWNHVAKQWLHYYDQAKAQWSELSDSELKAINGRYELLTQKLQEKYNLGRAEAREEIDLWTAHLTLQ
jgi:uncharacterized protein YjbJ (UPF0337 family)